MQHDADKLVYDALTAAQDILQFVEGLLFDQYREDKLVKAAVERKFEIIGEALNRLVKTAPETAGAIREVGKIIAFRNLVIHGYDVVSDPIVWDVIENKLPLLIEDLAKVHNG
jgi:uncharacterized protein with HEPN domain